MEVDDDVFPPERRLTQEPNGGKCLSLSLSLYSLSLSLLPLSQHFLHFFPWKMIVKVHLTFGFFSSLKKIYIEVGVEKKKNFERRRRKRRTSKEGGGEELKKEEMEGIEWWKGGKEWSILCLFKREESLSRGKSSFKRRGKVPSKKRERN